MPLKKPKEPKPVKEKKAKAPKEKKPKKVKPPKEKKVKKGKNAPEEVEGTEEEQQPKKKKPLILFLIPPVVIALAAVIIVFKVLPAMNADEDEDPEATATVEPEPPALPTEIPIGDDVTIMGMTLEADESEAQAVKAKTLTYTYINLVDAGKAAETYAGQLAGESPAFSVVDEEFVRQREKPDYTTEEGMVLLARNVPVVETEEPAETEPSVLDDAQEAVKGMLLGGSSGFDAGLLEPLPLPEPEESITYVHTVRITWTPGQCVVTVDEEVGKVTSPASTASVSQPLGIQGAVKRLQEMDPAKLGLEGESMAEYELIPMDATQMVDGGACINVYVYNSSNTAHSNEFVGSFLLSIDGQHLYRLDPLTNEVVELKDYP